MKKWTWMLALFLVMGGLLAWGVNDLYRSWERAKYYGPAVVRLAAPDGRALDEVAVAFGANQRIMEGARTIYRVEQLGRTGVPVTFVRDRVGYYPAYFFLSYCHPVIWCSAQTLENEPGKVSQDRPIDFGRIPLESLKHRLTQVGSRERKAQFLLHLDHLRFYYKGPFLASRAPWEFDKYYPELIDLCGLAYGDDDKGRWRYCTKSNIRRVIFAANEGAR